MAYLNTFEVIIIPCLCKSRHKNRIIVIPELSRQDEAKSRIAVLFELVNQEIRHSYPKCKSIRKVPKLLRPQVYVPLDFSNQPVRVYPTNTISLKQCV